ncbi:MAG TPA: GatB/YqeY domain-containing protein [Thermodesulfobacteriota bacterium]|nr:GatB/YqeY domain-containing protein [Thermodesulfobacteriota bacterium]
MSLRNKIPEDLKNALKNKNQVELSVLRMLQSAIRNKEIEKNKAELTDEEVIQVVAGEIKKRRESIEGYLKGRRQDLVDRENAELDVLMKYMPRQMTEDEIREEARKAIRESEAKTLKEIGKVMKIIMPRTRGKADGALVNKVVKEELEKMEGGV